MAKQDYSDKNAEKKETGEGAANTGTEGLTATETATAETPAETEAKQEETPASEEKTTEA